ncbi:MAG: RHS repeat protein, partial [Phycicoccus sp.]|nr:RHS repeat protein [Phycicoccus sp.]
MVASAEASSFLSSWVSGGRFRPVLRLTAGGVSAVLALTLAVTADVSQAAAAPVAAVPAAAPKAAKVVSRPDLVSARVTARAQGSRVEAESERTGTSSTWVNPDGTLTTEQHAGPIRFHDAHGAWQDVDLTLAEQADGSVAPKGHPGGLRLSGPSKTSSLAAPSATENDVVSTDEGKGGTQGVSLAWSGRLGKPTLAGNRATYTEVQPGVDLAVDALRTGYEQFLIIKTPAALAGLSGGGAAVSWSLPVKTRGLTARSEADGSVSFVDAKNVVASRLAAPKAWDAGVDPKSGEHTSTAPVKLTVAQQGKGKAVVTLTPDQGWLADPARVFPITIDPTYASASVTTSFDTYVSKAYPTATYSTATELRVGTYNGGVDAVRSFLNFPLSGIAGKQIVSASLSLYEFHSWSCTAKTFNVYTSGAGGSGTTWANQPAAGTSSGALTVAKGFSSTCAAGRVSVPITAAVQGWSTSGWTNGSLRLHASETDNYGWKKFYSLESSQDPYITFTYNRKPNAAVAPTMEAAYTPSYVDPRDNLTYLFTTDSTPRFYSKATDPDASTVSVTFEVHSSTAGTTASKVSSCATGYGASGTSVNCSPTTVLANNTYYYVRAAVQDDRHLWNGTWSAWTRFGTAYNSPPAPTVSCPGYTDGSWTDAAPTADVTCTIKATGITGDWSTPGYLDLTVDGVARLRQKITPTNDPAVVATTVTIPKTTNGVHIITAVSVARTLKTTSKTFSFGWGAASVSMPTVGTASSGTITVTAGGPPRGTSATVTGKVQWRVAGSEASAWTDGPTNLAVNSPTATTPVTATTSFTLSSAVLELGATAEVPKRTPVLLDVQFCFTYAGVATPQCTWSQSPRSVTRVPHAFGGGYPTAAAGPGQVALFTGEFNTSGTDVSVPGYSGDLSISRTHTSFDGDGTVTGWPSDPVTGVFGPGWTASLEGPDAGAAGLQVIDNTRQDGTIVLVDQEGNPLVYQNPDKTRTYKPGTPYLPATTDTTAAAADLTLAGTGTDKLFVATSLTLKEEDGTVTTWAPVAYTPSTTTAYVPTTDVDWKPVSVNEPGQVGKTTYGHDPNGSGRVTRIVAAVPPNAATPPAPAMTCPTTGTLVKGCRAVDISYAITTTATASIPGDYAGRVKAITATLWDPEAAAGAGAMSTTTVATYAYDTSGRLVKVTDPRSSLGTEYTWDGTSTRLASVKQTDMAAYRLAYDTTPSTPRVATVTRDNPAGSGAAVTLARYAYAIPLSGAGLPDLTSDVDADPMKLWKQASVPVAGNAYAVFGPDYSGTVSPGSGDWAGVDWSRADLQYADDQGYTVNTASYGAGAWQITATDYDILGNTVRELDSDATNTVTAAAGAGAPLDPGQVAALSTQTFYNTDIKDTTGKVVTPAGTLVTDTYGPVRTAALVADLDGNGAPDVRALRPHTRTEYDQNAPTTNVVAGVSLNPANGEPWRLPTTITTGAAASDATPGQADLETSLTTVNAYTKLNTSDATEGDPWVLGTPTKVTTGGITATTRYDTEGKATETRQPLSTGSNAGTTKTVAYTAGANPVDTACGNTVEWAGLACRTFPAAAPSVGAGGATTLPDSRTTKYTAWLQPLTTVETSGAATRTTQTRYDTAGRTTATWTTTSALTGSTPRPGTFTHYIPAAQPGAGLVDYTGNLNTAKTDADPTARTTTSYDAWGRGLTTTNDLGDVTTTTYVAPGQPGAGSVATLTENPAATGQPDQITTYTYDGTDAETKAERRGLVTGQTITRAGAAGGTGTLNFAAAYDGQGKLITQKLPGQVT